MNTKNQKRVENDPIHGWKISCDGCDKMFTKRHFIKSVNENGDMDLCDDCFDFQKNSETILSFVWNP